MGADRVIVDVQEDRYIDTKSCGKRKWRTESKGPLCVADENLLCDVECNDMCRGYELRHLPVGVWRIMCEDMPATCVLRLVRVNRKLSQLDHLPLNWCHSQEHKVGHYVNMPTNIAKAEKLKRFSWLGLRVLECDDDDLRKIVSTFPKLQILDTAFANMNGLEGLQPLRNTLRRLVLKNASALSTTAALQEFNHLEALTITWCADLEEIDLSENVCPALREVCLYQCQSLRAIRALPAALRVLSVGCPASITDISAVGVCTHLEVCGFTWCEQLTNISALSRCTKLQKCDLSHCAALVDVSALGGMKELVDLDLSHCKLISDVSGLTGCTTLGDLKLVGCPKIQDLSCLSSCRALGKLDISFCLNAHGTDFLVQIGQIIAAN